MLFYIARFDRALEPVFLDFATEIHFSAKKPIMVLHLLSSLPTLPRVVCLLDAVPSSPRDKYKAPGYIMTPCCSQLWNTLSYCSHCSYKWPINYNAEHAPFLLADTREQFEGSDGCVANMHCFGPGSRARFSAPIKTFAKPSPSVANTEHGRSTHRVMFSMRHVGASRKSPNDAPRETLSQRLNGPISANPWHGVG